MAAAYTPGQTKALVEAYQENPTEETVRKLCVKFNKTPKSIIAKLSKEGVYIPKVRRDKTGAPIEKKEEIVEEIGAILNSSFEGLEKAPKMTLKKLRSAISQALEDANEKPEWLEFIRSKSA